MRVSARSSGRALATATLTAAALVLSTLVAPAAAQAAEAIYDPIPEQPVQSRLGLVLEEFAAFPRSFPTPAPTDGRLMRHARINALIELPDGTGRMAVPDLNGNLYLVKDGEEHVYLDVAATFAPQFFSGRGLGQGFGYVAFHPEFAKNGLFYTVHTELASTTTKVPDLVAQPGTTYHGIVTEWRATNPAADTFEGARREVIRIGFAGQTHGIQQIDFNPTAKRNDRDYGLLYLAVGDGGIGVRNDDPQDMTMPHGKFLRIDPLGRDSASGRYGVPRGNPFHGDEGALGEIYAIGMRDPHRFSWDPGANNRMFLGHIGEHAIEAIYEVRAGDNYGWSEREGAFVFDKTATNPCDKILPLPADDAQYGYTYPVAAYDHDPPPGWNCTSDVGRAVAGGFVYRGKNVPALKGKYVFGDLVDGRVFYTEVNQMRRGKDLAPLHQLKLVDGATGNWVRIQDLSGPGSQGDPNRADLRFAADASGELYLFSKANGKIWKVTGTKEFAGEKTGTNRVGNTTGARNWAPITPSKWQFTRNEVILAEAGVSRPGPRRPFEYAVLTAGPTFGAVQIDAKVRLDTPVEVTNRDVIIVFGWKSDTEYYYAHLSTDNMIYPHNGIYKVNNADRERIDHQWNGWRGAPPAIIDAEWHQVRVKHLPATGEIAVYVDGAKDPLMTAVDKTFDSGRVGFGSFDNIGRVKDVKVVGTKIS
ncbi:PQQ-dependent sugar dehydrogenase [Polymorphospora sp. NPDC051019]|uniref:PQQ-dependent sugar dehydrogenase n=1 Tax=Polymorphospora sp. NPDC051019 TaxID=3155725 RepID=UPI00343B72C3